MVDAGAEFEHTRRGKVVESFNRYVSRRADHFSPSNLLDPALLDMGLKGPWSNPRTVFSGAEERPLAPFIWLNISSLDPDKAPEPVKELTFKFTEKDSSYWRDIDIFQILVDGQPGFYKAFYDRAAGKENLGNMRLGVDHHRLNNPDIDPGKIGIYPTNEMGIMVVEGPPIYGSRSFKVGLQGYLII